MEKDGEDQQIYQAAKLLNDQIDLSAIETATREMLLAFGEDPERQGLQRTPERVARMYQELLSGYRTDPMALVNGAIFQVEYEDMVIVRDIEFNSLCEHHLLPFMGRAHIAYIPHKDVIGLSKIPRIVDLFSHRLQIQERLTHQIATFLMELLHPTGVGVVMEAYHLCSMIRGVRKHGARMTTSVMLGTFRTNMATRMEFLDNISRSATPLNF